jgi:hypothetical protein
MKPPLQYRPQAGWQRIERRCPPRTCGLGCPIGTLRVLMAALLLGGSLLAGLSSCGNAAAPEQGVTPGKGVTPVIVDTDMNAEIGA